MNKKTIASLAILVVFIIVLALLPSVVKKDNIINLFILLFLYISLASSWNILGGYTGQTNLGQAAFFGIGSLTTRLLWIAGVPFVLSFLAGGLVAAALALLIGMPAFRLKGVYFAIGTLALAQILNITVGNALPDMSYNPEISNYLLAPRYYLFLGLTILIIGSANLLVKSKWGLGMMAVREGEDAAESLGISALKHKLLALLVSAFLTGLVGGAFAYYHVSYYLSMPFGAEWTFDPMMMAYIGGTGTIIGPIIGAVFFVGLKQLLILNLGQYHLIIFGTLFVLIVLFLPGGLMDAWNRIKRMLIHRSGSKHQTIHPDKRI
jgi:branched-chain amino acid transport system permease protein